MRYPIALLLALALAACGADGAPKPPAGASVSGQVKVGVGGSL